MRLAVPADSSSEAAAVAAGVAGLLVSASPGLTPKELCAALVRAATPLARAGGAAIVRPRLVLLQAHFVTPLLAGGGAVLMQQHWCECRSLLCFEWMSLLPMQACSSLMHP